MSTDIVEIIAKAKALYEQDPISFFLKNVVLYQDKIWGFEYDLICGHWTLKEVAYQAQTQGMRAGFISHPSFEGYEYNQYINGQIKRKYYSVDQILPNFEVAKGLIAKIGFELYYATEVSKLHDEAFRLHNEIKALEKEIDEWQSKIDDYEAQRAVAHESKRKEEFAKADRFKDYIKHRVENNSLDEKELEYIKKRYGNLTRDGKIYFEKIAPEYLKYV